MSFQPNNPPFLVGAGLLLWLLSTTAAIPAISQLELSLGNIQASDWQADNVQLGLDLGNGAQYRLTSDSLSLPSQGVDLTKLSLRCQVGKIEAQSLGCSEGKLDFTLNGQKFSEIGVAFQWFTAERRLELQANNIRYKGVKLKGEGNWQNNQWQLNVAVQNTALLSVARLHPVLTGLLIGVSNGTGSIKLSAKGQGNKAIAGNWQLVFEDLSFSDAPGAYIGEDVGGQWNVRFKQGSRGWSGEHKLKLDHGALLSPFFYLEPGSSSLLLQTEYRVDESFSLLELPVVNLKIDGLLDVTGSLAWDVAQQNYRSVQIATNAFPLQRLYREMLQPVLTGPFFEAMEVSGQARITAELNHSDPGRLRIELQDASLSQGDTINSDSASHLAFDGISGLINWSDGETVNPSRLNWQSATLLKNLLIAPGEIHFSARKHQLALLQPAEFSLFDGKVVAEELSLTLADDPEQQRLSFKGYLTPLSMELITQALGWPTMSGKLSGMIPGVEYRSGNLKVSGVTLVRLFDGAILIRDLVLDDLFGALPGLSAQVELKDIDLESLTRTFSFGKITGKLEGEVNNLRLEAWQPVAFDAWFATPADDKSRHRISQQAVDNISNLGGAGVSGALSRSFLRMFEEFYYSKLGLKCELRDGVCQMGGIEDAENGYYLVKGGGIPRIDIRGFNRRTDWSALIEKLKRISSGSAPVIE